MAWNGYFCLKLKFVRERANKQRDRQAEGEAGSPLSRKPSVGLDPRTLGS